MTSIKARLADALRKAGKTTNEYESAHLPIDRIVNTVLSLPDIAIVDVEAFDSLHRPNTSAFSGNKRCLGCGYAWPCPTLALLAAAVQAQGGPVDEK